MKRTLLATLLVLAVGCARAPVDTPVAVNSASTDLNITIPGDSDELVLDENTTLITLKVPGMTWGVTCVAAVRATLEPLPGVAKVNIDFPNRLAQIAAQEVFDADNAIALLSKAGYDNSTMVADESSEEVTN